MDIDTAFLNGELEEEVYVDYPPGCQLGEPDQALLLKKSLYGLKQSPRVWNGTFVKFLCETGLSQMKTDVCVFMSKSLIIAVYVDDIIIASKNINTISDFKKKLSTRFKTKDLGEASYVLKIRVEKMHTGGWRLHQKNYIDDIIQQYGLNNEKTVDIPIQPNHKLTVSLNDVLWPNRKRNIGGL